MGKLFKSLTALAAAGCAAGGAGFLWFAHSVSTLAPAPNARADAIVVLTGDEERITTGVRLMLEGRARRLLISGVHPTTRVPTELKRRIEGSDAARKALVSCCVDIGRDALNTIGNADEARQWVQAHGFHSIIVVTSAYHMQRSLAEFERALPETRLVAYPVTTGRNLRLDVWWRHWPTARLLAAEYVKLLGTMVRLGVSRMLAPAGPGRGPSAPAGLPSASANARVGQ
jgi:uncharacterized SAM-binding protein YcdF (DUF218 family)